MKTVPKVKNCLVPITFLSTFRTIYVLRSFPLHIHHLFASNEWAYKQKNALAQTPVDAINFIRDQPYRHYKGKANFPFGDATSLLVFSQYIAALTLHVLRSFVSVPTCRGHIWNSFLKSTCNWMINSTNYFQFSILYIAFFEGRYLIPKF